jgi:hypothetical protein
MGTVPQEEITIVNTYVPNISIPNLIIEILVDLKEQINLSTIMMGDFNTSLSQIDHPKSQQRNFRNKQHYRSSEFSRHL